MADKEKWWAWDGDVLTYVGEYALFEEADAAARDANLVPFWIFSEKRLRVLKDEVEKALAPLAEEPGA